MKKLKEKFSTSLTRTSPIVQGLIIQEKFLMDRRLTEISVTAVKLTETRSMTFLVQPAQFQIEGSLTSMSQNIFHHLHVCTGHPAIDAVYKTVEVDSQEMLVLLVQVFLSTYANHKTKGIAKRTNGSTSIAEYYCSLAECDNMVYLHHQNPLLLRTMKLFHRH